jgi:hypothetical protein
MAKAPLPERIAALRKMKAKMRNNPAIIMKRIRFGENG